MGRPQREKKRDRRPETFAEIAETDPEYAQFVLLAQLSNLVEQQEIERLIRRGEVVRKQLVALHKQRYEQREVRGTSMSEEAIYDASREAFTALGSLPPFKTVEWDGYYLDQVGRVWVSGDRTDPQELRKQLADPLHGAFALTDRTEGGVTVHVTPTMRAFVTF